MKIQDPKSIKSVRNDLKETYESFKLFESTYFDHQILRRLVAFLCMKHLDNY